MSAAPSYWSTSTRVLTSYDCRSSLSGNARWGGGSGQLRLFYVVMWFQLNGDGRTSKHCNDMLATLLTLRW